MAVTLSHAWVAVGLIGIVRASEPSGIVRCQEGAKDILGERKAFAVQVCNLFGATCYMNHPSTLASDCTRAALTIDSGECKLYPIFEYANNRVRSGDGAVEELSTVSDLGCLVSSSNGSFTWSGACVSVQCYLSDGNFAGPGMTGIGFSRTGGITDTATATFTANTVASLPQDADQLKNVFLYRTGAYIATYRTIAGDSSSGFSNNIGNLPTSDGNNYGPVACPSSNNLMTSATAAGISAADLRMCGNTEKWVYYNLVNLLVDASHYATLSAHMGSSEDLSMGAVPFLAGRSKYKSGALMSTPHSMTLLADTSSRSAALMCSAPITPLATGAAQGEAAGTWRNYAVVFYCDDYTRTDLTTCAEANRKHFYVADPNPNAEFGCNPRAVGGESGIYGASATRLSSRLGTTVVSAAVVLAMNAYR